jgi:hypothetical protein
MDQDDVYTATVPLPHVDKQHATLVSELQGS